MSVTAATGFSAAGVRAGLKASGRPDVALVVNNGPLAVAAGVFTTNRVVAAPVVWSRQAVADGVARAVILNSGSANACTGQRGTADTADTAARIAELLGCQAEEVLVCSTGVIGEPLPMAALLGGAAEAAASLETTSRAAHEAACAIMTTDTVPKEDALDAGGWTIGGMIKGGGMLAPGMATMLAVLTTDAVIDAPTARAALSAAVARTVNRINSDGCMSTNDTVVLLASGASGATPGRAEFDKAVTEVLGRLGRRLVADAEGATHDIAITVTGAATEAAAEIAARTVSASNLLKCAVAGGDPNWGRVLSQLGTVPEQACPFDPEQVDVAINGVTIFSHGEPATSRSEVDMSARETRIDIALNVGDAQATVWTNDLTHGYITINADYTT